MNANVTITSIQVLRRRRNQSKRTCIAIPLTAYFPGNSSLSAKYLK